MARDPERAASARALRHLLETNTAAYTAIETLDDLPEHVRPLAVLLAAKLGRDVLDCGWFVSNTQAGRVICKSLGSLQQGVYVVTRIEGRAAFLTALQNALAHPVWDGPPQAAGHPQAAAGEQGADLQRKARISFAQWALVLLVALVAFQAAPARPIASLATTMVQPFHGVAAAVFRVKRSSAASATSALPPALRQLEAQADLEDAVALLSANDTKALSSMAKGVHREAWAAKDELGRNCTRRTASIRQEVAAALDAISAGVRAGQPLLSEPVAAAMRRGSSMLEALEASCAADKARLDDLIKRSNRIMRALANQRGMLEFGTTEAEGQPASA